MGPQFSLMGGMWIFPLVGITVMCIFIYSFFFKGATSNCYHFGYPRSLDSRRTLEILETRYAKGELTIEEFEQMKRNILN